nr:histone-like nucleoid-structuring protein, MvaT/MvaU family [Pseudomonas putida]
MSEYGYSLRNVIDLLDPQSAGRFTPVATEKAPRRATQVKQYKKPNNGEVIETKGSNHKILKEWKAKYGAAEVEGWVQ